MNPIPPQRELKVTLVPRDDKDDPSILDIVRVAIEDGLRTPASDAPLTTNSASDKPASRPRVPIESPTEEEIRGQIEKVLDNVIERFKAAGKEPKFDPATWVAQLSKVWAVIHKAKAAGVQLRLVPDDSAPPAEGG